MHLFSSTSARQKTLTSTGWFNIVAGILFILAILTTCSIERSNWPTLVLPFTLASGIYLWTVRSKSDSAALKFWLVIAFAARVALVPLFPNLSDDVYRFLWDGYCTLSGTSPYGFLPSELIADGAQSPDLEASLYSRLNSPDYYSVYPPLSQYIFAFSAWVGGGNWYMSTIILKIFLLVAEMASCFWMFRILKPTGREHLTLLYALNPLVIMEIVGNVHFEGIMIAGLIGCYYYLGKQELTLANVIKGAIALGAAILVKLIPILALPFLFKRMSMRHFTQFAVALIALIGCLTIPFLSMGITTRPADSIDLYFHTFEFNAGIYYVLRWFGYLCKGYNMIATIGTVTGITTVLVIATVFLKERSVDMRSWPVPVLAVLTVYFALASIVHPWYICGLVALSVFTRFRYAIAWSLLAFLSYSAYRVDPVNEILWLVALEYIVVGAVLIYELRKPESWA